MNLKRWLARATVMTVVAAGALTSIAGSAEAVTRPGGWSEVVGKTSANCHPLVVITPFTKDLGTITYSTPPRVGDWFPIEAGRLSPYTTYEKWQQFGIKRVKKTITCNSPAGKATIRYTPDLYTYRTKMNTRVCYGLSCQFVPGVPTAWK